MSVSSEMIHDVLNLPRNERSYLAKKLIESLEADESFSTDELAVFERRSREVRDGKIQTLGLEELREKVDTRTS